MYREDLRKKFDPGKHEHGRYKSCQVWINMVEYKGQGLITPIVRDAQIQLLIVKDTDVVYIAYFDYLLVYL